MARVLIDTAMAGTFMSIRWARADLQSIGGRLLLMVISSNRIASRLDHARTAHLINGKSCDRSCASWSGSTRLDLLAGRDLLFPYRLTIDLTRRCTSSSPAR